MVDDSRVPKVAKSVSPEWRRLVESKAAYSGALRKFLDSDADRVASLRHGFRAGGFDRAIALQVFPYLPESERLELFDDLVLFASSAHGSIGAFRNFILELPRQFVLANIETHAESYLQNGGDDEFRRFLELYDLLDDGLRRRLAERAVAHSDAEVREAGAEFVSPRTN